jgi:hypothetical protein
MGDPRFENIGDVTTRVMEECAEVIVELCKVQRFGWLNYHPEDPVKTPNVERVHREIADLEHVLKKIKETIKEIKTSENIS